jgi:hypothetical protein
MTAHAKRPADPATSFLGASPKAPERWQSGRSRRTRNAEYAQVYRGFESLPLRQHTPISVCIYWIKSRAISACPNFCPNWRALVAFAFDQRPCWTSSGRMFSIRPTLSFAQTAFAGLTRKWARMVVVRVSTQRQNPDVRSRPNCHSSIVIGAEDLDNLELVIIMLALQRRYHGNKRVRAGGGAQYCGAEMADPKGTSIEMILSKRCIA